jgi:hypothetical protein
MGEDRMTFASGVAASVVASGVAARVVTGKAAPAPLADMVFADMPLGAAFGLAFGAGAGPSSS